MRCLLSLPHIWTQKSGRAFSIFWSDGWEHGLLEPTPTDEELRAFYNTAEYDDYMQARSGNEPGQRRSIWDRLLDPIIFRVVALLGEGEKLDADFVRRRVPPPSRVLDVGCGPGVMLAELKADGYEVAGVDPNQVALSSALERGITMFEGTGETMPEAVPINHFDLVTMNQSLEHTRDPAAALRRAAARLKSGGLMAVEVPNCASAGFRQQQGVWFHTDAGRHINFFTHKSLDAYFRLVGLNPIEFGFSGITHQFARLQAEKECWDALYADAQSGDIPARPSRWTRLLLFFRVLWGKGEERRDMVWVLGRKP